MNKEFNLPPELSGAVKKVMEKYFPDGFCVDSRGLIYPVELATIECRRVIDRFPYPPSGGKYVVVNEAEKIV